MINMLGFIIRLYSMVSPKLEFSGHHYYGSRFTHSRKLRLLSRLLAVLSSIHCLINNLLSLELDSADG